ncbi:MAG: hypothetical protein QY330_00740 [Candidatus Dojkabacteria bacterium]|uniref:Uncharacterized protein n=1 Tax=Candidatus Dojkabacteria bacterium TaxID=2099670 RepID=A0A952AKI8_9BACT|nr:hypothetical protein [Candidatus Dojkabacteria bacterium]WKZ28121.1 MAG: hypothetical protein QY330_00740 [Candidatus Dojkabacteria bacterium]
MQVGLDTFNISYNVFMSKVGKDLSVGVRIKASTDTKKDVVRVWTDTKNWQFSLVGLIDEDANISIERVEIQSFGDSLAYLKLIAIHEKPSFKIDLQKLGSGFAELAQVSNDEAQIFLDNYMQSSVNLTLTEQLFSDYAKDENTKSWLTL